MRPRHDVKVVVAAQNHVLPLRQRRKSDIGDRGFERRLCRILLPLRRREEVFVENIETGVPARYRLTGDAYEG
jgi:hypothetical protein